MVEPLFCLAPAVGLVACGAANVVASGVRTQGRPYEQSFRVSLGKNAADFFVTTASFGLVGVRAAVGLREATDFLPGAVRLTARDRAILTLPAWQKRFGKVSAASPDFTGMLIPPVVPRLVR